MRCQIDFNVNGKRGTTWNGAMKTFVCDYVMGGIQLQKIMEAKDSIDCVLSLAQDGATAIRVHALVVPIERRHLLGWLKRTEPT